ncbi:MAG: hypothetical protein IJX26_00485, partial [Clostridia bacterium]|nr:hypothetical protein [Clostridia bacterium]
SSTIQAKSITLTGKGIMAGFVAQNSGIISSSYFKNSNIINESAVVDDIYNKTAGFVAVNSGRVLNSYTKGNGVSATNYRGKDSQISATKAGSSAGFVFDNSGTIENSYSNILVSSYSGGVAGFVYRNNANGVINQSYSASVVNASYLSVSTVLPFVGVGIDGTETNKLLSYGKLNNCYYLQLKTDNFDKGYEYSANMDMPYALNDVSFADPDNLLNFAFVEGGYNESIHGVWTYYQILNKGSQNNLGRTILPELTSANQISRSVRYLKLTNDGHELFYANDYGLGSENNPYIIRNADEYNAIFAISSNLKENSFAGSIRFVNDIDFAVQTNNDVATINTTLGYTLGDVKQNTLTVIDGNGMKISSVNTRNNQNSLQTSLGLFNKIEYSIIKNLDIYYEDMPYTSTSATYSGGLAGKINNSSIINLNLVGNNTTITARNFAGGLAGVISGDSAVYNVNSNLSVEAGYEELTTNYYQYINFENFKTYANSLNFDYSSSKLNIEAKYEEYISKLSYAGGLAAIIDIGSGEEYSSTFNLNKITIGQSGTTTVTADIAGFVAGYLSRTSFANRITARINNSSFVFGSYISAGFIAENYGKIRYSEVVASETNQTNFDKAFGEYIVAEKTLNTTTALNNANNSYGNLSFVRAETDKDNLQNISAGFVGVNYGGSIDNSYTKANISANSSLIGGFVGVNYGGSYESVYAQNYMDLNSIKTNANRKASIGGFIAKNALSVSNGLSLVYNLVHKENTNLKVDSVVIATFYDKSQINNLTKTNNKNIDIDYLIAQSENKINSSLGDTSAPMNVYYLSYEGLAGSCYNNDIIIKDSPLETKKLISKSTILSNDDEDFDIKAEAKPIDTLYDIDSNDKEQDEKQLTLFTTLFMSFDINVWDKSDNKKFFPVLKENPILNYYEINEEQDLLLIILHPDANFVLTGDIALTSERVDYVLDVVFSGTLVGRIDEEGNAPTISGIKLTTSNATKTAGFFRSTNGATINNINLSYSYLIVNNSNGKSYVGLLSAEDKSSIVTSVNIYTHNSDDRVNDVVIQNDCYVMTKEGVHVSNFGGLFGVSTSCQITASHVSANVSLNAGKIVDDETQRGALGGLVGYLSGANASIVDAMILNSSYIGDIYATSYINVGGLVGYSENASLTNSKVDASLNLISSSNFYAGGVIGKQVNSYIEEALANVKVIIANESEASASYYVGGISGYVSNSSSSKSADIIG